MSIFVPKKKHGQHFLLDKNIAKKISSSLLLDNCRNILEIGGGSGMLTQFLTQVPSIQFYCCEVDADCAELLKRKFPGFAGRVLGVDFLKMDLKAVFGDEKVAVIGNFPYNISTEILFYLLEHRQQVTEIVGMVQKEVAERISSPPGCKSYGITSVLLQAYYSIEYLFTVSEKVFYPRPAVKSAVIRMTCKNDQPTCDYQMLSKIVKTAFNQRRKMLRNALSEIIPSGQFTIEGLDWEQKRAEDLTVSNYIQMVEKIGEKLTWPAALRDKD